MAVIRFIAVLCSLLVGVSCGVIKTKPHILRFPRSIDLSAAHSLINEPKLDSGVVPTFYKLEFKPNIEEATFRGTATINVTWTKQSEEILLHANGKLDVMDTSVLVKIEGENDSKFTAIPLLRTYKDQRKSTVVIKLSRDCPKGTLGIVTIEFMGKIATDSSEGMFRTQYEDNGQTVYAIGTQARPNNARKFFPCFDEPAYKTPFNISILRDANYTALSNTDILMTEEVPGTSKVWDHFETTPPMSTFTLGFVISKLSNLTHCQIIQNETRLESVMQLYARPELKEALEPAMRKILFSYIEILKFFNISLPIDKLDVVAMPNYQGIKPSDNWGLIIFKESDLLSDGYVHLAQELAYQWLGAYVTPSRWNEAHLNKALVGYIAANTAIKLDNGTEMDGKWPMTILYSLYYEFSKRYPHSRITGMKQETTCSKIELIFRMLNYTLGEQAFKDGLQIFMNEKKYGTFTSDDIWNSLNKYAIQGGTLPKNQNVNDIALSWTSRDRIPVVNIERDYGSKSATIKQRVYLRERPHDVPNQDTLVWSIPLVLVTENNLNFSNTIPKVWMTEKQIKMVDLPGEDKFIIVNPEEIGPFPVNYDTKNWNMLAKYLNSASRINIPVFTRAKLLHDAWNLAYAGDLSFATALNMTLFLSQEREHLVWDPVFTMIDHIGRHIDSSAVHKKFETYVRLLLTPLYEELSEEIENEGNSRANLKGLSKTFLCRAGYRPCIEEAQTAFKKWMDAENPDEGNPVPNQYICPVFKWGAKEEWEFGLQRIINFPPSRKASERTYLLKTLAGCPISSWKIERLLNITILEENSNFTDNDVLLIFSMLTGGSRGYTTLLDFLQTNWDTVKLKFENKTALWDNIISSSTSVFTTQEGLDMVTKLYVERQGEFGSAEHIIEKSLKNIREETKWSDDNLPVIEKWLDNYLKDITIEDKKFIGYSK